MISSNSGSFWRSKRKYIPRYLYEIVVLLGILISFGPQIFSKTGPRNYSADDDTDAISINKELFIHSLLVAVTVATTLALDGVLDLLYGTRFISSIYKPRWFLLLALGVPNSIMYFSHVNDSLGLGKLLFSIIRHLLNLLLRTIL